MAKFKNYAASVGYAQGCKLHKHVLGREVEEEQEEEHNVDNINIEDSEPQLPVEGDQGEGSSKASEC